MAVRGYVTFEAEVPRLPQGAGPVPPGRDLAELLSGELVAASFTSSGVKQHDSYGWYFHLRTRGGTRIWSMLQLSDNWLLITRPQGSLLARILGRAPEHDHQAVCDAINAILERDPRFRNVRWYTRGELLGQASGGSHRAE